MADADAAEGGRPVGRPGELTPELLAEVRRLLPVALYIETVADYAGVHRSQVHRWIRRGAAEAKRLAKNPRARPRASEALYLEFRDAVKKGLAAGEIRDARTVRKAAAQQWQAAAWRLERRFPERWGRRERLEHTGPGGGAVRVEAEVSELRKLPPDELLRLHREGLGLNGEAGKEP